MSRASHENSFVEEDARWLPFDTAILQIRTCLHEIDSEITTASRYLTGESSIAPEKPLSEKLYAIAAGGCAPFESFCDELKKFRPGDIDPEKTKTLNKYSRIVFRTLDDMLPANESSGGEIFAALSKFNQLVTYFTPGTVLQEKFRAEVEAARVQMHSAFKCVAHAVCKLEKRRAQSIEANSISATTSGTFELGPHSIKLLTNAIVVGTEKTISTVVAAHAETQEHLDAQDAVSEGIAHNLKRLAKTGKIGGRIPKTTKEYCCTLWSTYRYSLEVKQSMNHEGAVRHEDVFNYFSRELAKYQVYDAEKFSRILDAARHPSTKKTM